MLDVILKIIGMLGGVIGIALGIYNFAHARRKETRERLKRKRPRNRMSESGNTMLTF
jgi:hypothetical protein